MAMLHSYVFNLRTRDHKLLEKVTVRTARAVASETNSLPSLQACTPRFRLQLAFVHPRRLTDIVPLTTKLPLSSHPNPYSRRHADRPSIVSGRHKCAPPQEARRPHVAHVVHGSSQVRAMSLL